jgi:hypothetical protein
MVHYCGHRRWLATPHHAGQTPSRESILTLFVGLSRSDCRPHTSHANTNYSNPLDLTNILWSLLGAVILLAIVNLVAGERCARRAPHYRTEGRGASLRGLFHH